MDFEIKITITNEFPDGNFKVDLMKLQDYLINCLKDKSYGESVVKFFWGFELFKFDGGFAQFFRNDIESWKYSVKWLVVNSNFDWITFNELEEKKALVLLKYEFLNSIERIDRMKKKPKDFNYKNLQQDIDVFMTDYIDSLE
jgi:hypothetical protein